MARKNSDVQEQQPEGGGSYVRDPETGELTLLERTAETDDTIPFEDVQE